MSRYERRCSVHKFDGLETLPFQATDYSKLKFGSNRIARKFGHELANKVFADHSALLMANKCVVIPSPYNHVQNAASMLARHMLDQLNHLMVHANGEHLEWSIINRKVSYTNDYGFLPKEQRAALINQDVFHFNSGYVEGKVLLFVDDVVITGTHEDKLRQIMDNAGMVNPSLFLYYGEAAEGIAPETEAAINFAAVQDPEDYANMLNDPDYQLIVRPIKYLLSRTPAELRMCLISMGRAKVMELYYGCLGEGYHTIPTYQRNFEIVKQCAFA